MVDIARAARISGIEPTYNNFLYATIGADVNGSALSVLSALARLNLDPWREAASLAALSGKAAALRLAALIAALPAAPSTPDECGVVAARLIKLLPQQSRPNSPLPQQIQLNLPTHLLAAVRTSPLKIIIYVAVLLMALVVGVQWLAESGPTAAKSHSTVSVTTPSRNVPLER